MRTPYSLRFTFIYLFLLALSPASQTLAQSADSTIFSDDFNRAYLGNFWESNPSWSIINGAAYNFIDGTGGSLRTTNAYSQTSYVIETSAKGFTNNYYREFRVTFGQADLSSQQTYQMQYTAYGGGRLTLSKSTDNIYDAQVLDEAAIFPNFNYIQWYTFKIAKYKSGLIQVFVNQGSGYDSIPLLEAIDSSYAALGHTGWQVDTQTFAESFFVDWIAASKPKTEKPAIREKPLEDSLITQVSTPNSKTYEVSKLIPGVKQFIDRDLTITTVPEYLNGASFIQSANDDKLNTADSFLTFFIKAPSVIYIGYDPRGETIPSWLSQFTKTTDSIVISDTKSGHLDVYSKLVEYGQIYPYPTILGGNLAHPALGSNINYLVAAVKRPDMQSLQAEDALVSGASVSTEHTNYNGTGYVDFNHLSGDYIEWTVQIDVPGTYNLGFKFSNGDFDTRTLQLTDNNKNVGAIDFSATSSWDSWSFLSGPNVFLSPGTHKLRLTAIGESGPNIDELSLYFVSPTATFPIALSKRHLPNQTVSAALYAPDFKAYPNPFLQGTRIYYGLKEKAMVNLSVYTLQGQQVQILDNRVREVGNYQATFNAAKLAKGIYMVRLQIGKEVKTGKLIKE